MEDDPRRTSIGGGRGGAPPCYADSESDASTEVSNGRRGEFAGDAFERPPGFEHAVLHGRHFRSTADALGGAVEALDVCRVVSAGPGAMCVGVASALATKAILAACVVPAVIAAPAVAAACAAAAIPTAIVACAGPVRRLLRARLRDWYHSIGGGLVEGAGGDPGYVVRDACEGEDDDEPPEISSSVADAGAPKRRRRKRHFVPYRGGKISGAYLATIVAEVRSIFAGRGRDSATEHGARRALVTRMREHGMRPTDVDRVREQLVNAVFYVSREDEANRLYADIGRRLGFQAQPEGR